MKQSWYQSKTLWFAVVSILILLASGFVSANVATYPKWIAIVFGGLSLIFTWVMKIISSKNPNAPILSGTPSAILGYLGGGLIVLIPFLTSQGIKFPYENLGSIVAIVVNFIGADAWKNVKVIKANPKAIESIVPSATPVALKPATPVAPVAPRTPSIK